MSGLTTHVLDTAEGIPAQGVRLCLYRDSDNLPLGEFETNSDGRCDQPLLETAQAGTYRLEFFVADYFRRRGHKLSEPPFLDRIIIRFGIADPNMHTHVPLLVSPFAYSTYRGS